MEDPNIVSRYFKEHLRRGFWRIFDEQRRIANNKIYSHQAYRTDGSKRSRSGRLQQALESPSYSINAGGSSLEASYSFPTYLRFLDMKRLGNYRIYNRPIWGILYKQTFRDMKYEFSDWLKKQLAQSITDSYQHFQ